MIRPDLNQNVMAEHQQLHTLSIYSLTSARIDEANGSTIFDTLNCSTDDVVHTDPGYTRSVLVLPYELHDHGIQQIGLDHDVKIT